MSGRSARFRVMASKAGRNADHTSPLRRVVSYAENPRHPILGYTHLLLECGHVVLPPRGAWGDDYSPGTRASLSAVRGSLSSKSRLKRRNPCLGLLPLGVDQPVGTLRGVLQACSAVPLRSSM